jgi:hypothetical protein
LFGSFLKNIFIELEKEIFLKIIFNCVDSKLRMKNIFDTEKQIKKQASKTKECPPDKILNPPTKRCVSKTSKIDKGFSKK